MPQYDTTISVNNLSTSCYNTRKTTVQTLLSVQQYWQYQRTDNISSEQQYHNHIQKSVLSTQTAKSEQTCRSWPATARLTTDTRTQAWRGTHISPQIKSKSGQIPGTERKGVFVTPYLMVIVLLGCGRVVSVPAGGPREDCFYTSPKEKARGLLMR